MQCLSAFPSMCSQTQRCFMCVCVRANTVKSSSVSLRHIMLKLSDFFPSPHFAQTHTRDINEEKHCTIEKGVINNQWSQISDH